ELHGAERMTLGPLPREDALRWLGQEQPRLDGDEELAMLCQQFDYLPLALTLVWLHLESNVFTPADLLDEVRDAGPLAWIDRALPRDQGVPYGSLRDGLAASFLQLGDRSTQVLAELGGVAAPSPLPTSLLRDAGARLLEEALPANQLSSSLERLI